MSKLSYEILLTAKDASASTLNATKKTLDGVAASAAATGEAMTRIPKSIAPATRGFNNLNFSVQQMVRELPAATLGFNMFFLAISNNLPIMADQIKAARVENELLSASGKKGIPVWKQVAGSLFSWQSALVLGVTALTLYGSDIAAFTTNTFRGAKAIDAQKRATEQLTAAQKAATSSANDEVAQLSVLYRAATDEARSRDQRRIAAIQLQKTYPAYLQNLSAEQIIVGQAATAYKSLRAEIIASAKAQAIMAEVSKNEAQLLDLRAQEKALASRAASAQAAAEKYAATSAVMSASEAQYRASLGSRAMGLNQQLDDVRKEMGSIAAVNKNLIDSIDIEALVKKPSDGGLINQEAINTNLATIGGIENKINSLQAAQAKAGAQQRGELEREIILWQQKLNLIQRSIATSVAGNVAQPSSQLAAPVMSGVGTVAPINIPLQVDEESLARVNAQISQGMYTIIEEVSTLQQTQTEIDGISQSMSQLGAAVGGAAGNWLQYGANITQAIGQALPSIGALVAARKAEGNANAISALTGVAAAVAPVPLLGPVLAVAAIGSLIAAFANIPKFANGGVVYGRTLAEVGEYSGAVNNPEVIAPLSKLQKLIQPAQGVGSGQVVFTIRGRDLEGVLNNRRRAINRG